MGRNDVISPSLAMMRAALSRKVLPLVTILPSLISFNVFKATVLSELSAIFPMNRVLPSSTIDGRR